VSENFFPGWTAAVDGRRAATDRAQYNLIGVELPAGAKRVTLHFDDAAYERGKVITWIAILIAVALACVGLFRSRRPVIAAE
jgi:uncharacterized membrane protein YfhO